MIAVEVLCRYANALQGTGRLDAAKDTAMEKGRWVTFQSFCWALYVSYVTILAWYNLLFYKYLCL